jgi:glutaredoxin-related protein
MLLAFNNSWLHAWLTADMPEIKSTLRRLVNHDTWPTIFIGGKMIGGNDDLVSLNSRDQLMKQLNEAGAFQNDFLDD